MVLPQPVPLDLCVAGGVVPDIRERLCDPRVGQADAHRELSHALTGMATAASVVMRSLDINHE
jgi:hypothetical protein